MPLFTVPVQTITSLKLLLDQANILAFERGLKFLHDRSGGCFTYKKVDSSYTGKHLEIVDGGG